MVKCFAGYKSLRPCEKEGKNSLKKTVQKLSVKKKRIFFFCVLPIVLILTGV
jgi:hypothetical protein